MSNEVDISRITGSSDAKSLSIQNNYRFDALIRAIDFFSQKFNIETLVDFAGDFINEILTLNSSAVFVYDENADSFTALKIRLYDSKVNRIPNSKKLQNIAKFHGSIIKDNFSRFFTNEFINAYKPVLLIPLIHNDGLLGFIVTNGKVLGEFDEDDYSMAEALMRLFNNAFERNYFISEIESCHKRIDKLSFEFYTANKTFDILFDESNPKKLLSIGLDIFSEVSGSIATSIALYDKTSDAVVVKAYKSQSAASPDGDLCLYLQEEPDFHSYGFYGVGAEFDKLKRIFKNPERFSQLNAEYVVLIADEEIRGFVTLGKRKSFGTYSKETLNVVCELARDLEARYSHLVNASGS